MENSTEPQNLDRAKVAYMAEFAASHLSAFKPHKTGETLGRRPEVWRNVSSHCLGAGVFADILAAQLDLLPEKRKRVVHAAILHDWYKKHEQTAQRAAAESGTLSLQTFDDIRDRDFQLLRELGIDEATIQLTGANVPDDVSGPIDDEQKIVWFVDAMLSDTKPVRISERFDNLERGWDGNKEDPERAKRNAGFSNSYKPKFGGRSLYEIQREVGDRIGREFSERLGFSGDPSDLPEFLKGKFMERVDARKLNTARINL